VQVINAKTANEELSVLYEINRGTAENTARRHFFQSKLTLFQEYFDIVALVPPKLLHVTRRNEKLSRFFNCAYHCFASFP
jgi:hypothetical protein